MTQLERDVVVVGAGPSGSVVAREAARSGLSVLLVDRQLFPRYKVCGACLGPAAVSTLHQQRLAKAVASAGAVPLDSLRLWAGGRVAALNMRGGLALTRGKLDQLLVEAALEAGVHFIEGARAQVGRAGKDSIQVELATREGPMSVRARVVVDASGLAGRPEHPPGRGAGVGPAVLVARNSRVGLGATFPVLDCPLRFGELVMATGRAGYVGLVRVENGDVNLGAALDPACLSQWGPQAAVASVLAEAGVPWSTDFGEQHWKGTPALTRRPGAVASRRIFRIGDAAGYVEPFTGEGMGWALSSALAVTPLVQAAVSRWEDSLMKMWAREHHATVRRSQWLCFALTRALRRPRLTSVAVRMLRRTPSLAAPFVRAVARASA